MADVSFSKNVVGEAAVTEAAAAEEAIVASSRQWRPARERWLGISTIIAFIVVWEIVYRLGLMPTWAFPSPWKVVLAFQELIANGKLLTNTAASVGRQITGVFFAALIGIPAGLALGASPTARAAFLPLCRLLYPIPGIAWIPLAILWFGVGFTSSALQRGLSVLLMDGPGQGATLRRHGLTTRFDYEVPVGKCIDWLARRSDVDMSRIAMSGSSLGGYYAARAGAMEPRLAAAISHGGVLSLYDRYKDRPENHGLANHMKWVFGADSLKGVAEKTKSFDMRGVFENMKCPYLILHGGHDVLGVQAAREGYDYAKKAGVDVTFILVEADMTGAEHCQHDNPTLGQELMIDWLADKFGIDQRKL
jgi:dienelactone hydrolase